jgi:LysR family glycine cleavage system transcriptional activator
MELTMVVRTPPLQSLRACEAAARLGSFTRAAEELGLTQGAVSHHVKALEGELGVPLFLRLPRKTVATAEGRRLAEAVRAGLERIAEAAASLKSERDERALTVSVLPGFAVKWLFPRLISFDQRHPEIRVSISASAELADFAAGEADLAIRYGRGRYAGLLVERILDDEMFPVCSPALAAGNPPLNRPEDLARHVLLHDDIPAVDGVRPGWRLWLERVGAGQVAPAANRQFGQSNMVLQAAMAGLGVALGRGALVADDLAQGRLVRPFGPAVPSGFAYYVVCPHQAAESPKVAAFRAWLRDEAGRF